MRVPLKYDFRDLQDTPQSFTALEIINAGSSEFSLSNEVSFFSSNFRLNTQADEGGINITGFIFLDQNTLLTSKWGMAVFDKIQITDVTYQTGTIYAFGDIAGSVVGASDPNRLQDQIDSINQGTNNDDIGTLKLFATSETRPSLIEFALDNAISQGTYAPLFAKIGHKYNDQHVAMGDADLSASGALFYPTPVPNGAIIGWASTSTWLVSAVININHGFGVAFDEYKGQIFVRDPAVPGKIYDVTNLEVFDTGDFGQRFDGINNDLNNCNLILGDSFGRYAKGDGSGQGAPVPTTWEYKVVIKPIGQIYSTADQFAYIKAESITPSGEQISALRYVQNWSLCTNFTSGNTITIPHPLSCEFDILKTELLIRDPATPDKHYDAKLSGWGATGATGNGQTVQGKDNDLDNVAIQIGAGGVIYMQDSGALATFPTTWEYKVVLIKPNLIATYADMGFRRVFDIAGAPDETFNLPDADTTITEYTIKRLGVGVGKVLFTTQSSQTIDGNVPSTYELENGVKDVLVVFPSGGNWFIKSYNLSA